MTEQGRTQLHQGDCLSVMPTMDADSIDSIVTDPPYGLSFMGKDWDHGIPGETFWREALRVAKPGAHLLAFGGTRTYHRLAVAIEDAGWELRDCIMWVYGSGFPKSHNLKGEWQGWGTALKPAWEPIIVARKPLIGTVAQNVQQHGTGGINVDGCRVGTETRTDSAKRKSGPYTNDRTWSTSVTPPRVEPKSYQGRWPANLIHDGSDEVTGLMGDAARFFYCSKASKADRGSDNKHPTVKPTDLMRYLCRLVTPPNGIVFDPFMGSGSTGKAAVAEGFRFTGIELSQEYLEIAAARIAAAIAERDAA
jgi:DNA modification methylase